MKKLAVKMNFMIIFVKRPLIFQITAESLIEFLVIWSFLMLDAGILPFSIMKMSNLCVLVQLTP